MPPGSTAAWAARGGGGGAAGQAARILFGLCVRVFAGGPPTAVEEVLADPRLRGLPVSEPWLAVPDPRRAVLEEAIREACSVGVDVVNA